MLLRLLRLIRGYVGFSVHGKYPERFLNITSRNGVRLWEVQRHGDGLTACMYRRDYLHIRPLAYKAGVRLKIQHKGGMPELISRHRDRAGILIGACAFILTVFVMSLFIWSIDVTGLETVSETQMRAILKEHGLYVGAFKPGLDYQHIARDILIERHEIGWMAVNVSGSYASVEIKEEALPPKVENIDSPCNIKAKCDGQIVRIEAREGKTLIPEGSGVIKGQLIVSGVIPLEQSGNLLVHADARVVARTKRQARFSMPEETVVLRPNGEVVEQNCVTLFGLRLPYHVGAVHSPYSATDSRMEASAPLGVTLPIGVETVRVSALKNTEQTITQESAKELLTRESELYETFSLSMCTVEQREFRWEYTDGVYALDVTYTCLEDIAYEDEIGTDANTDTTRYELPTESDQER